MGPMWEEGFWREGNDKAGAAILNSVTHKMYLYAFVYELTVSLIKSELRWN